MSAPVLFTKIGPCPSIGIGVVMSFVRFGRRKKASELDEPILPSMVPSFITRAPTLASSIVAAERIVWPVLVIVAEADCSVPR